MNKSLVIVFVKNLELGAVKTRLAKTIGDYGAFVVYSELVKLTEQVTSQVNCDKRIYFSKEIEDIFWSDTFKAVQKGIDLGERMSSAFREAFESGYEKVILIGSDLPELNVRLIENSFEILDSFDTVFGPAEDGGYYLIGMKQNIPQIFENKPWSQPGLFNETLHELQKVGISIGTLETLNDIDTYEDLISSEFYKSNIRLQQKIEQLND